MLSAAPCLLAQMSVSLSASAPSPAHVGTLIAFTAASTGAEPGSVWYRFRVRRVGQQFGVVKDYGPDNFFEWTATDHEGVFEIEASARNGTAIASTKLRFEMLSNVTGKVATITATAHPLVWLFSAPPCEAESRMRVRFESPGDPPHFTPWKACRPGLSMNFYLAGMYAQTPYSATAIVDTGTRFEEAGTVRFSTVKEAILPATQVVLRSSDEPGLILQSTIGKNISALDLDGELMWYYAKPLMLMTQPSRGGSIWGITATGIREFDLAGMTLTETTVARVNEQLASQGKGPIANFHHEVMRLPDGRIAALASVERILRDVQGPGPVDVIGDMIVVLNRDLEVVWTWDAFAFLDVKRKATLNETCMGCATLAKVANDWTHSNSLQQTSDGNLLLSARNQDFVYKIAYENGEGDGHVIWKLGKGGDFQLNSSDPSGWFSHQHDAGLASDGIVTVLDDGNIRQAADPKAHSRGQALRIDEQQMTAELILNVDLGVFSSALGSAQKLPNGHYAFLAGFLGGNTSLLTEVDASGAIVYQLRTGSQQYRAFRMRDLYSGQP